MFVHRSFARGRVTLVAAALSTITAGPILAQGLHKETLPTGTVLPVKLNNELSSKTSRPGDRFSAIVRYGKDDSGLPEGTKIEGVVREALPSGDGKPGSLDVDFTRVVFPDGSVKTLEGSLVSLDAKSVKKTEDGRLVATADKGKDRTKFIGIGAGAGLLIGALTKQNTLASILLGAGAGYAANEFGGKKPGDVNLKAGTEFGVRLDRQFAFETNREAGRIRPDDPDFHVKGRPDDDRYYRAHPRGSDEADRLGIGMMIDDRDVRFGSARPIMRNETVLVPLKEAAKAANFDYSYDPDSRVIKIRNGSIRASEGSRIAVVDGERRRLDVAPEYRDGQLYVPMQIIAMSVRGSAYYDKPSKTVVVTTHARER